MLLRPSRLRPARQNHAGRRLGLTGIDQFPRSPTRTSRLPLLMDRAHAENRETAMAQRRSSTTSSRTNADGSGEFTAEERAAMKDRAKEVRAARGGKKGYGEADLLAKIAEMA